MLYTRTVERGVRTSLTSDIIGLGGRWRRSAYELPAFPQDRRRSQADLFTHRSRKPLALSSKGLWSHVGW